MLHVYDDTLRICEAYNELNASAISDRITIEIYHHKPARGVISQPIGTVQGTHREAELSAVSAHQNMNMFAAVKAPANNSLLPSDQKDSATKASTGRKKRFCAIL